MWLSGSLNICLTPSPFFFFYTHINICMSPDPQRHTFSTTCLSRRKKKKKEFFSTCKPVHVGGSAYVLACSKLCAHGNGASAAPCILTSGMLINLLCCSEFCISPAACCDFFLSLGCDLALFISLLRAVR